MAKINPNGKTLEDVINEYQGIRHFEPFEHQNNPSLDPANESGCDMNYANFRPVTERQFHELKNEVVGMRQQLMAAEDNLTSVAKATSQDSAEAAKHVDVWNLEKKLRYFADYLEEQKNADREQVETRLQSMENFLQQLSSAQQEQRNAFSDFAEEIRHKKDTDLRVDYRPQTNSVSTDADDLEHSLYADLPPEIEEMARRAGIGLEDLHDIALKVTEVKKADAVAELQLAHVEKVNEQLKEITLKKLEGEQKQDMLETQELSLENDREKEIRLAEIDAETKVETTSNVCEKEVRNHRDVEISKARYSALNAVSEQWSKTTTSAIRWLSVSGGVGFVAWCCVQIAQVYFAQ